MKMMMLRKHWRHVQSFHTVKYRKKIYICRLPCSSRWRPLKLSSASSFPSRWRWWWWWWCPERKKKKKKYICTFHTVDVQKIIIKGCKFFPCSYAVWHKPLELLQNGLTSDLWWGGKLGSIASNLECNERMDTVEDTYSPLLVVAFWEHGGVIW